MSVTMTETYNGWKNYPTWAVNLWLSNDEGLYRQTVGMVAGIKSSFPAEMVRVETADAIRDYVKDDLTPDLGASFAADLLGYALDTVDWFEIADAWLEED